ncbi:hypothetical protein B484DRAFT_198527 [Ochromonadaceae sp. CCMP2298]|nr:hypothetical protein B484DRAFT_198527 [Ochromonadaceae sp. CCMP2298]
MGMGGMGGMGGGRGRGKKTSYLQMQDGCIGDAEFFARATYSCCARASADTILLHIDWGKFWTLVGRFELQGRYVHLLTSEQTSLHRNSTLTIVRKLDNNMNRSKMARMMSVTSLEAEPSRAWLPDSAPAQAWACLSLALLLLQALAIPAQVVDDTFQAVLEAVSWLFCVTDVYMRANVLAVQREGGLVTEVAELRARYISSVGFRFDAAACSPLALLSLLLFGVFGGGGGYRRLFAGLRVFGLLRLHRGGELLDSLMRTLRIRCQWVVEEGARRVLYAVLLLLYTAHVAGCLLCLLAKIEQGWGIKTWIDENGFPSRGDLAALGLYLRSFYWALYTLTTVGYGSISLRTSGERVFAVGVMLLGSLLSATLSALLASQVESVDHSSGLVR